MAKHTRQSISRKLSKASVGGSYPIIYVSINQSIYLSIYQSINLSIYLSTYPPIYLSTYPPIHLSTYPPIYLSTYLPIYSTYLFYIPAYLPTCLPAYVPTKSTTACKISIPQTQRNDSQRLHFGIWDLMCSIKAKPTIEKSVSFYPSFLEKELYKLFDFGNYFDHELLLQHLVPQKNLWRNNRKTKIHAGLSRSSTPQVTARLPRVHLDAPSTMARENWDEIFVLLEATNCTC